MRSPISTLATFQKLVERQFLQEERPTIGMREYETNDNNVVKGSHVADYRPPTQQIPREIALAIVRSPRETSATELINTM